MIGKLTGQFDGQTEDGMVRVLVGGVGYVVRVPLFALTVVTQSPSQTFSLFIHTAVREDALDLYGFPTEEELSFFKQLMSVSGIGPKTAIGILNVADVTSLKRAIAGGDSITLTKVFGIGKKSAERLVVELRDKLAAQGVGSDTEAYSETDADVIEALMALGYRSDESRRALKDLSPTLRGTNERIAAALKNLGTRT